MISSKSSYLNFQTNRNASPKFLLEEPPYLSTSECTISAMELTNLMTSFFKISVNSEKNLISQKPKIQITFFPFIKGFNFSYSKFFIIISVPASPNPKANSLPDLIRVLINKDVSYFSFSYSYILLQAFIFIITSNFIFFSSAFLDASTGLA